MTADRDQAPLRGRAGGRRGAGHTALYCFCLEEERLLDAQAADLEEVATEQGGGVEWYTDWQEAKSLGRPAYCGMLLDLRAGRVAWLVVWRLDKLGLAPGGVAELLRELAGRGAGFTSLQDELCLEPEALGDQAAMLDAMVFCQRRQLGQQTRDGCAAAKKSGQRMGGSRRGRVLTVTEEQRAQVHTMHAEGRPKAYIARLVGISRDTVYRLLGCRRRKRTSAQRVKHGED